MPALFSLKDKVAVVTGGASGIGRAIARCFARQEARVIILDKDLRGAEETAADILRESGSAEACCCDVGDQGQVKNLIDALLDRTGRLDILVNSAGIAHIGKLENTGEADFERLFVANVKGTYNTMHAAIPAMKRQNRGVILNLASVAAGAGLADRFAYSMTKGAVVSMTLSVARDYVNHGIRCNCISPARVHTPFVDGFLAANYPGREAEMFEKLSNTQPIGRMGTPEEIACLALYLCSDEAAFITGCDYPIDGGFMNLR
jgi:NAD(P)-dependent dehydrogenase (short-subunit alcohol dehydrogenase family)